MGYLKLKRHNLLRYGYDPKLINFSDSDYVYQRQMDKQFEECNINNVNFFLEEKKLS